MRSQEAREQRPEPTKRQREVLQFIRAYASNKGYSPSLKDLADGLGIDISTVWMHIGKLVQLGLVAREPYQHRSIRVLRSR